VQKISLYSLIQFLKLFLEGLVKFLKLLLEGLIEPILTGCNALISCPRSRDRSHHDHQRTARRDRDIISHDSSHGGELTVLLIFMRKLKAVMEAITAMVHNMYMYY
jgi:hypothetical protein